MQKDEEGNFGFDLPDFELIGLDGMDGSIRLTRTPKVTGKGQIYFANRFLSSPALA